MSKIKAFQLSAALLCALLVGPIGSGDIGVAVLAAGNLFLGLIYNDY